MKRFFLVLIFLISSLTSLAERFVINSKDGYANLRREASVNSGIIKKVDNSMQIILLFDTDDEWNYVAVLEDKPHGYVEGYIHKSQLKLHPETYVISSKDGYANVRYKPKVNSELFAVLSNGEYVTKLGEEGDWYYIEYTAYDQGYIHKSQLKRLKK